MSQTTIDDEPEDAIEEQDDEREAGDDEREAGDDEREAGDDEREAGDDECGTGDDTHVEDVGDGSGCTEIWEHLSEKRRQAK